MILKRKPFYPERVSGENGTVAFSPHKTLISFELCVLLTDKTKQ